LLDADNLVQSRVLLAQRLEHIDDVLPVGLRTRLREVRGLGRSQQDRHNNVSKRLGPVARLAHGAADSLNNIDAASPRIAEYDHVHGWQIDPFGQAASVSHQTPLGITEPRQDVFPVRHPLGPADVSDDEPVEVLSDPARRVARKKSRLLYAGVEGDDSSRRSREWLY
jgi:hypothetical protein